MASIVRLTGGVTVCLFLAVMMHAIHIVMTMQTVKPCIGTITQVCKVESKKSSVISMLITYNVDGVDYQCNLNGNMKYAVGNKVDLIYSQSNPLDVELKAQVYQKIVTLSLATLIGCFVTGVAYLLTK